MQRKYISLIFSFWNPACTWVWDCWSNPTLSLYRCTHGAQRGEATCQGSHSIREQVGTRTHRWRVQISRWEEGGRKGKGKWLRGGNNWRATWAEGGLSAWVSGWRGRKSWKRGRGERRVLKSPESKVLSGELRQRWWRMTNVTLAAAGNTVSPARVPLQ